MKPFYQTSKGKLFIGKSEEVMNKYPLTNFKGKIQLIFTSPPFPLTRKKKYGNEEGLVFGSWLAGFASLFSSYLKNNGSIVIEMGNTWIPGRPVQSTITIHALLAFLENRNADLKLCQEFIVFNPARLPSPAQWVTVKRIRVKDSFTRIWWMSKTDRPKANNRNILKPYSDSMVRLLQTKKYNSGQRPSEHVINAKSFLINNNGAIPPNVLEYSNTSSTDPYLLYCRKNNVKPHPARMPIQIPEFFIKFLTNKEDIVLDPFAGSNTTGAAAEKLGRKWISIEASEEYAQASISRFIPKYK
jgi:DNA modification methylase